jgi:hypothetical protein
MQCVRVTDAAVTRLFSEDTKKFYVLQDSKMRALKHRVAVPEAISASPLVVASVPPRLLEAFRGNADDRSEILVFLLHGSDSYLRGFHTVRSIEGPDVHLEFARECPIEESDKHRGVLYKGVEFKSRLEARLRAFFDSLGVDALYEVVTVRYGNRTYTLDFWLPGVQGGLNVELKPTFPTEQEMQKCEHIARMGFAVILLYGRVRCPRADTRDTYADRPHAEGLRGIRWNERGEIVSTLEVPIWDPSLDEFGFASCGSTKDRRWDHPKLHAAYEAAGSLVLD